MGAALAAAPAVAPFHVGQPVWLAGGKGRPAIEATVRELPDALTEPRFMVTLDEGLCAGLRLWAADTELTARRTERPESRK